MSSRRIHFTRLLSLVLACGCSANVGPSTYEVTIKVDSDPGKPLAGARFSVAGKPVGESDASGSLLLKLPGRPGDVVQLDTTCPEGHRSPDKPIQVVLRPLAERGKRAEYHASCPPSVRNLVVSVRAQNGPNLPLRYLGKEIARTDEAGTAHALLKVPPGESITLTLDTSEGASTQLMPQHPELKLTVPERDEIVIFDQTFAKPKPKAKPKPPPEPEGPIRL